MTKVLVNQSLPMIQSEIEQVLEHYSEHPYQQAFANPDLRQELIAYVLTHVQSVYVAVDPSALSSVATELESVPSDRSIIRAFIHQGIHKILQQQHELSHQVPDHCDAYLAASHWLG
ncbi:MAG: hypothetical protein ACP5RH_05545 [Leptodesmis sp.]|uniref:hypothetical protein n=1 Tax=Leptodesmis sp. TaxID=3100501 RepID=UPI003D14F03A